MAIWQYTFKIIPKDDLKELGVISHLSDQDYNSFAFWKNDSYSEIFFEPLTQMLLNNESWSKDIRLFGTEESTCIEIFVDKHLISEVTVRIDYRSDYSALLNKLIEFCNFNALALLDEQNNVLPLNETTIIHIINNSVQYDTLKGLQDDI